MHADSDLSKNTIPGVRALGRRHCEAAEGDALISPLWESGRAAGVTVSAASRSSCDPGAVHHRLTPQLIVCLAHTLVAARVTLIDERLEFK